jgi:hypothetical protein
MTPGAEPAVLITGRLTAVNEGSRTTRSSTAFVGGQSRVVADVQVFHLTLAGRRAMFDFSAAAERAAILRIPAEPAAAAPAGASANPDAAQQQLTAAVDDQAKRIGGDIAKRIIAWAVEQGWLINR